MASGITRGKTKQSSQTKNNYRIKSNMNNLLYFLLTLYDLITHIILYFDADIKLNLKIMQGSTNFIVFF